MKTILLTQAQVAKVDDDIYELVKGLDWRASAIRKSGKFYATHGHKRGSDFLHWYVAGYPTKGYVIDHINGDTLDNRRENLRAITVRQNCSNTYKHRAGKLVGATWHKRDRKWISSIWDGVRLRHLGMFTTPEAAHAAYLTALSGILAA